MNKNYVELFIESLCRSAVRYHLYMSRWQHYSKGSLPLKFPEPAMLTLSTLSRMHPVSLQDAGGKYNYDLV